MLFIQSTISWFKLDQSSPRPLALTPKVINQTSSRFRSSIQSIVQLPKLTEADMGTYLCEAKNKFTSKTRTLYVKQLSESQLLLDLFYCFLPITKRVFGTRNSSCLQCFLLGRMFFFHNVTRYPEGRGVMQRSQNFNSAKLDFLNFYRNNLVSKPIYELNLSRKLCFLIR